MKITIESTNPIDARADLLVVPLARRGSNPPQLPTRVAAVDRALGGAISARIEAEDFRGKDGESLLLFPDGDLPASRLLLLGLGSESKLDLGSFRRLGGRAVREATARRAKHVAVFAPSTRRVRTPAAARALAEGAVLAGYRFDRYRNGDDDAQFDVESISALIERATDLRVARAAAREGVVLAESQNVARDLSNLPGNALPPAKLASEAERIAVEVGLHSLVMDVAELRRRKMGAILAVGGGSANPPRLIVLEHNRPARAGARKAKAKAKARTRPLPTVCLVGKGVTFDSGGISIKPSPAMDEMKHDMSGAAAVVGALRACALLKVPLHVVGVIGAAENLPSGTAYRPGDVLTSASKKTIEVLNTDAEGRVVLADALHYARTEYEPVAMLDLATLTGACVVALGSSATGLFGNNDRLVEAVRRAGEATGERVWPMPLWEDHRKAVRSTIADVKNTAGREAASSTAAAFLDAFVADTPWVHLDIAGTGWTGKAGPYQKKGATGVGVRLLLELLREWKSVKLD